MSAYNPLNPQPPGGAWVDGEWHESRPSQDSPLPGHYRGWPTRDTGGAWKLPPQEPDPEWESLKLALWNDRVPIAMGVLTAIVAGSVIYAPERYVPLVQTMTKFISDSIHGVGEVIPG